MGKWLQVYRSRPFLPVGGQILKKMIVAEAWPNPLLSAVQYLPHDVRGEFPTLLDICPGTSDRYKDEILWLSPDEVKLLRKEFGRFQQICECDVLVAGVDGAKVKHFWQSAYERDLSDDISSLNTVLEDAAIAGHWVCLQL